MPTTAPVSHCHRAALYYLEKGWNAIPLCSHDHAGMIKHHKDNCQSPGKAPLGRWQSLQNERQTEEAINQAFNRFQQANVGIVMGHTSNLVGLDVDGIEGEQYLAQISAGDLPDTLKFFTSTQHRYRLLYRIPEGHPAPVFTIAHNSMGSQSLRILGQGSQTVAPPSRHFSGESYTWAADQGPEDIDAAEAPQWLLDLLINEHNRTSTPAGNSSPKGAGVKFESDDAVIPEGHRESTLLMYGGMIRAYGAGPNELRALYQALNARCQPQLSQPEIERVVSSTLKWQPRDVPNVFRLRQLAEACILPTPVLLRMEDVEPKPVKWLWKNWLPVGFLTGWNGDGGIGKSTALMDLVARTTRGLPMPDLSHDNDEPSGVVLVVEDDYEHVVQPRLVAAGADLTKIVGIEHAMDKDGELHPITVPEHMHALEKAIEEVSAKLVIIDPVLSFYGAEGLKSVEVRRNLMPLTQMAKRTGACIVLVRHFSKGSALLGNASYRAEGSTAWTNSMRHSIFAGRHPNRDDRGVIVVDKSNLCRNPTSWTFQIITAENQDVSRVMWIEEGVITPEELADPTNTSPEEREATTTARATLISLAAEYRADNKEFILASYVHQHMEQSGISKRRRTQKVARELGFVFTRHEGENVWMLPPVESTCQPPNG